MKKALISLEGIHGSGKTTLANRLLEELKNSDVACLFSKDQAGTPFSEAIRNLNLDERTAVDLYTETFLVAAARRQTYVDVIVPALNQGQLVITERFVDSFFAYGAARNLPSTFVTEIAERTCGGNFPDLTLLLDIAPRVGMERIAKFKKHRIELEGDDFHNCLRQGYLDQAKSHSQRFVVIDASQPLELVLTAAMAAIRSRAYLQA